MRHKFNALMVLGSLAVVPAQNTFTRQGTALLVRIDETELSTHPTAGPNNVANCLVVAPDGGARLELRRQEFFNGDASEATYEMTLNAKELDLLRAILQGDAIRSLPRFIKPTTPLGVHSFHVATPRFTVPQIRKKSATLNGREQRLQTRRVLETTGRMPL